LFQLGNGAVRDLEVTMMLLGVMILGVFLVALAAGSWLGDRGRRVAKALAVLAACAHMGGDAAQAREAGQLEAYAMKSSEVGTYWNANAPLWTEQVRAGMDVYRDHLNTPAFLALLPDVSGMAGLDIGCGEGTNTRALAARGARMTAIDIAPNFVRVATEIAAEPPISYMTADAHALPFADGAFDFATAFMSLMDMPEQDKALSEACRVTKPGGFLQFSILHPCFVPMRRKTVRDADGHATGVLIEDYFTESDGDIERWHFSALPKSERPETTPFAVPRFHRTLSRWVEMLFSAGWVIEAMAEPRATEAQALAQPIIADTRDVPIFLIVRVRKAGVPVA
jgi:ubiquinone/menaquinone biosynthesis C-methylase UbiE